MRREPRSAPVALALAVALAAFATGCAEPQGRPDVVLITLDTTRFDHVSAYGYARTTTPELDALARDGVLFRRAWSTSAWTLPAHASMFTGLHPTSHGAHFDASGEATLGEVIGPRVPGQAEVARQVRVNRLPDSALTLAELLRAEGYATAAFTGGPWLTAPFGLLQGYAVVAADAETVGGRGADELTHAAVTWLLDVPRERPVHLLVNYFDPHAPYAPQPGFDTLPRAREEILVSPDAVYQGYPLPARERERYVDRYDGEIRFMDHYLGRLLSALRTSGRYRDALIIAVADHGEEFGEHAMIGHTHALYDSILRVPLIVRYPRGRDGGTSSEAPISVVDLLGLVAREVGIALPPDTEGVPIGQRRDVFAQIFRDPIAIKFYGRKFDRDLVALVRWPWKLILSDAGSAELYALDRDPAELDAIAAPERRDELAREIAQLRASYRPRSPAEAPESVPETTQERLRELGYVD